MHVHVIKCQKLAVPEVKIAEIDICITRSSLSSTFVTLDAQYACFKQN